jgi:hypothetical protein
MSEPEQRSPPAHARPVTVEISRFWSPEEALAVFELIDDIRDKILALHGEQLREALRDQRGHGDPGESRDAADDDRPL